MVLTYSASRANLSDVSSCIGRGNGCSWNIFGYIYIIFLIKTLVYETGEYICVSWTLWECFFLCPFKGRLDLLTNRQGTMLSAAKEFPGLTVLRLFFCSRWPVDTGRTVTRCLSFHWPVELYRNVLSAPSYENEENVDCDLDQWFW